MAAVAHWGSPVFSQVFSSIPFCASNHGVWHCWKTDGVRKRGTLMRPAALCFASLLAGLKRAPRASSRQLAACQSAAGDVGFTVEAIDGKGLGALATVLIRRGDRVLQEAPLICMDTKQTSALDQTAWQALDELLRKQVECLRSDEEARFWALGDAFTEGEKTAAGVFCTNAVSCEGQAMLFPQTSRMNHSCRPNVVHSWQGEDGLMVLHATRAIQPGEELCICYVPGFLSQEQRQAQLMRRWRFSCCCPACKSESTGRSDELRLRLAALDAQLSAKTRLWQSRSFTASEAEAKESALLSQVSDMTELILAEFGPHPAILCQLFYDAFVLLLLLGRARSSGRMIRLALEESTAAAGPSAQTRRFQRFASDPRTHPAFSMSRILADEPWGEDGRPKKASG
ncbi:set5 [Symbiodinium sp. CCMP2456]|nr:set5 [Symbiodinium sp. CCMP2456]